MGDKSPPTPRGAAPGSRGKGGCGPVPGSAGSGVPALSHPLLHLTVPTPWARLSPSAPARITSLPGSLTPGSRRPHLGAGRPQRTVMKPGKGQWEVSNQPHSVLPPFPPLCAPETPGELVQQEALSPTSAVSLRGGLGETQRICISNGFPGEVDGAGPGPRPQSRGPDQCGLTEGLR